MDYSMPTAADYAYQDAQDAKRKAAALEERLAALERAVGILTRVALDKGDITINDARAMNGLRPANLTRPEPEP